MLFAGLIFSFAFSTLFESDVGDIDKTEYTQNVDVDTATQVAELTSVKNLLFAKHSKEFVTFKSKDSPDLEIYPSSFIKQPTLRALNKTTQILFYETQHGSAGGLPA